MINDTSQGKNVHKQSLRISTEKVTLQTTTSNTHTHTHTQHTHTHKHVTDPTDYEEFMTRVQNVIAGRPVQKGVS